MKGIERTIYLDHASTTALDARVLEKMRPYLTEVYGNANSVHSLGRDAVNGLDSAREITAKLLNADFNEIYFTSGGTECDNWALNGFYSASDNKNKLVISSIEHAAMLNALSLLKGAEVCKIKPQTNGIVLASDFEKEIDDKTFLTSLMLVNNEVGTIQPVKEVAEIAHKKGSYFYADAVQAAATMKIDVKELGVDMLGISAHKFYGPKGVGVAYIKNGTKINGLILGGHQERSIRGGTSNVAGAIGLAYALKFAREELETTNAKIKALRDDFVNKVLANLPFASLNGDKENRVVTNANISFKGINGEELLFNLDLIGVCASLGAACSAGSIYPSYVLTEMGVTDVDAKSSLRFTFGKENTQADVDHAVETLIKTVKELQ